jgi:tetratricopeptide (TPR) repeat protein
MTTDWLSAIGILLSGLVIGFMFVYASMRKRLVGDDLDRRDLEAKRDALIEQLRAGDLSPDERARTEREAAEVLRALDLGGGGAPVLSGAPALSPAVVRAPAKSSAIAGFLWGAGSVAAVFLLVWYVTKSSTPKPAPSMPAAAAAPQALEQLEASVKSNPDDNEARIELAKAYLDRENLMGVFEQTTAVLAKNPNEPRAQTYQAIVRMAMGQQDQAKKLLDSATATDPKLTDAWVALAYLRLQQGDKEGGTRAIEEAIKQHPEDEPRLRNILAQMTKPRTASPAGQVPSPAQTQAPASSSGPAIHVTINLAPGARTNGVLFVYAREAGQTAGPPAAVKRVEVASFPMTVELTASDSMLGTPLPAKMRIEARLDADGNAMTKDPSDPTDAKDGVALGDSVTLTLH